MKSLCVKRLIVSNSTPRVQDTHRYPMLPPSRSLDGDCVVNGKHIEVSLLPPTRRKAFEGIPRAKHSISVNRAPDSCIASYRK